MKKNIFSTVFILAISCSCAQAMDNNKKDLVLKNPNLPVEPSKTENPCLS